MLKALNNSKCIFFLGLYFYMAGAIGQNREGLIDRADSLYHLKQYKEAGRLYEKAFESDGSEYRSDNLYNAACSYALGGDTAAAFYCLETAIDLGWNKLQRAESDDDLNSLKNTSRWKALETRIKEYDRKTAGIYAWGVYLGILFILFFYNLFLFVSTRDITLLYYTVTIFLYAQFESIRSPGLGHYTENIFLWQRYFIYLGNPGNFFICLSLIFQLLFAKTFLSIKHFSPGLNKITNVLIVLFSVLCAITAFTNSPLRTFIYTLSLLSLLFLFFAGVFFWYKKQRQARFFVIADFAYITGVSIVLLHSLGLSVLYFRISVFRPDNIGQVIFFGLLSFAIGDKINLLRSEKEEAQERALEHLEGKVKERTAEVVKQKEIIEEKHKEITDSINYAERIQKSFLASKELLDRNLPEYFVFFKPKDVVSGDFYWAAKLSDGCFALVTADSTGHGVPGAIMSLLNITSLEKAVEYHTQASDILNHTRKTIIERLKKDGSSEGGKDGMDCSVCVYDFKNRKLTVAAAHNPVWIIRGNETIEIKPDKMPVGRHDHQDISFSQQEINLNAGDVVYTITDGFPDQFGGEKGKKFMSKNLRNLFAQNCHLSLSTQKELLEKTVSQWIGTLEQVDDITIIGIRI
jgi:serine phosphatase RsbU (regulator of sigma subunit)